MYEHGFFDLGMVGPLVNVRVRVQRCPVVALC